MEVGKENRGKERKGRPGKLMFPGLKSAETFFLAFLFGANLFFDTRGRCRLVSSLVRAAFDASSAQDWETSPELPPVTSALGCSYPDKILKEFGECMGAKRLGQFATSPSLFITYTTPWAMKRHSALQIACV